MKIKIKVTKLPNNKLITVKAIKDVAGIGLKEAKDICDGMWLSQSSPIILDIGEYSKLKFDKFKIALDDSGGEFQIQGGGTDWERDVKLLSLGLGDSHEYADFLSDHIRYFDEDGKVIREVLSKLKREELSEIINKIVNDFKNEG